MTSRAFQPSGRITAVLASGPPGRYQIAAPREDAMPTQKRVVKFGESNAANEIARMSDEEIDGLTFGLIELAPDGTVLRYNAAEAEISGRPADKVIGRNFFTDVAPCTNTEEFEGRFRRAMEAGRVDLRFIYVFDHHMTPTQVSIHIQDSDEDQTYRVMVKRVVASARR